MVLLEPTVFHSPHSAPSLPRMVPELSRIYHSRAPEGSSSLQSPKQAALSAVDGQKQGPEATVVTDPTLTALAQLGLYRSGCSKAFVTLMEDHETRVIAETTTSRVMTHNYPGKTGCLVGTKSLGVKTENIIDSSNVLLDDTCHVIRDLNLEDSLKNHPFALQCPHARFYAEVPLRGSSGELFGTYGILDSNPRPSFARSDLGDLCSVAASIAAHLENVWTVQRTRRIEQQLSALIEFVKGVSNLPAPSHKGCKKSSASSSLSPRSSTVPDIERLSLSSIAPRDVSAIPSKSQDRGNTYDSALEHQVPCSPREGHQQHVRKCSNDTNNLVLVTETTSTPRQASWLFSRASSLLQESMDVDGVLFLDAARNNSRSSSRASFSDWDAGSSHTDSRSRRSSSQFSRSSWSEKHCEPLGLAISEKTAINDHDYHSNTVTEGLLHDLFTAFPNGEIFHSIQTPKQGHSIHQSVASRLAHYFPDAQSMIFLPLWSWDKSRWLTASILWTHHEERTFSTDDLCYLRIFGDSIVSEFAHIDRNATEKSKSDLLSSVSHELRSPLHGMLASSELLQTTSLEPAQQDMVTMIETCGLTLLDTMNYLLDFAKINNLTRVQKKSSYQDTGIDNLTSEFDLDTLVEDVTDSLYAGHRSLINSSKIAGRYLPVGTAVGTRATAGAEHNESKNMGDLSVVVRIEERDSWKIQSISGGWRRIIMNLLGNAFKFTHSGFIEVSLAQKVERRTGIKSVFAHLTITDTGTGIERDFLDNKLFTPFSQENILTEGVGLGLSIVQQLVTYMDGQIDIKSEVGVRTQVDVYVPVEFVEKDPSLYSFDPMNRPGRRIMKRVCLVGLNAYTELRQAPRGLLSADAKRKLSIRSAMSNILLSQPGWILSFADSLDQASGDIVVLEESTLKKIAEQGPIKTQFQSVIVLGEHGVSIPGDFAIDGADVIYIPQPLGPRKVLQALQRFGESLPHMGSDEGSPILGPIPGIPMRGRSLSEAFAMAKGSESPPVMRENVSEFSPPPPQGASQRNLNVLIVDDNDINLKILSTFMRKIGCNYETASNGLAALKKYQSSSQRFDYVLMDISMPIMDGIVASSRIREYEEEHSLPRSTIMAVTGVACSEMQQQAFAAGVDDYLVKPLSLHDLKRIMSIP